MRIIGGEFKGRTLAAGRGSKAVIRPTSQRTRTVMFDLLIHGAHGNLVQQARVLDLFAGTGALGLEALSRGAESAVFVDHCRVAAGVTRSNIARMGVQERATVLQEDASRLKKNPSPPFSLLFLDPPYEHSDHLVERAVRTAMASGWMVQKNCTIVTETPSPVRVSELLEPLVKRQVGLAWIGIFEPSALKLAWQNQSFEDIPPP